MARWPRQLVECVPNFSEGRDAAKIDAIVQSHPDRSRSRPARSRIRRRPQPVRAHLRRPSRGGRPCGVPVGGERRSRLIDLTKHQGAHPRIGAADVVPFIPIEGVTLEECVRLAERVGAEIWEQAPCARVPVRSRRPPSRARQPREHPPRPVRSAAPRDGQRARARTPIRRPRLPPHRRRRRRRRAQIPDRLQHQSGHAGSSASPRRSPRPSASPPAASAT